MNMIPKALSMKLVPLLLVLWLPFSGCAQSEGPGEPPPAAAIEQTEADPEQAAPEEEPGGEGFELRIPEGAEEIRIGRAHV